mmetsp:Transcript_18263/g.35819  ORF Transcript_18263/g.35819 Transcript_18263/m.35819 type:complete len:282 (-) Transcript_18263:564-1409(-)
MRSPSSSNSCCIVARSSASIRCMPTTRSSMASCTTRKRSSREASFASPCSAWAVSSSVRSANQRSRSSPSRRAAASRATAWHSLASPEAVCSWRSVQSCVTFKELSSSACRTRPCSKAISNAWLSMAPSLAAKASSARWAAAILQSFSECSCLRHASARSESVRKRSRVAETSSSILPFRWSLSLVMARSVFKHLSDCAASASFIFRALTSVLAATSCTMISPRTDSFNARIWAISSLRSRHAEKNSSAAFRASTSVASQALRCSASSHCKLLSVATEAFF